jgi:hypothetical protein
VSRTSFKLGVVAIGFAACIVFAPTAADSACYKDPRIGNQWVCDDPQYDRNARPPPPPDNRPLRPSGINVETLDSPRRPSPCPPGQVLTTTGRCVRIGGCPPGQELHTTGVCVRISGCPPGQVLHTTGVCVSVPPEPRFGPTRPPPRFRPLNTSCRQACTTLGTPAQRAQCIRGCP